MTHNLTTLVNQLDLPKKLDKKRDALLLAEIAAWLHMLGKFQESFLQGNHRISATQIPPEVTQNYLSLESLLKDSWTGNIWKKFNISKFGSASLSLSRFIEAHQKQTVPEGLLRLMSDAHGRGSGIEKGVLNRFTSEQVNIVYLSTAFGRETDAIDLVNLYNVRHNLYDFLQTNLTILKTSLTNSNFDWKDFRKAFVSGIEDYFRQTVAETRRPLSDVSLFDQTSASVAFLKAALAQNLLTDWQDPTTDKYHWRLLKIGLDGIEFWSNSVRIGDLLARKELINKALDEVQTVIEEEYPLGLQVYRDENGSVFIVPDIDDLLNATVKSGNSLCEHFQEIANHQFKGEAFWIFTPKELWHPTRNTLKFGRLATSQPEKLTANFQLIASHWNIQEKRDICPVCSLRSIGSSDKALKLKVCDICCDRRTNRAKDWTGNLPTTIWIDEVADTNGRLALIVGKFELESWLTGEAFNSIISFNPIARRMHNKKKKNINTNEEPKEFDFDYTQLIQDIESRVFTKDSNLENLVESMQTGGSFDKFYKMQVTDTDLGEGRTSEDASILALAMMRQNPSFARLRRVWETTQKFWKEVITDVPDTQLPKVRCRLIIKIRESEISRLKLVNFGNYDLVFRNVKLSVLLWDDRLITTDNLRYVAKQLHAFSDARGNDQPNLYSDSERAADFVRRQLLNQQVSIEEPTGYGSPNRLRGQLEINNDGITFDSTEYSPVIQILAEPSTFIALVPANNLNSLESLNIVRTIKTKYEREMGKVRNRLPLHLGVVYFDRRTPLQSALDAGRQMLTYKSDNQKTWQVNSISQGKLPDDKQELANATKQFEDTITLELTQDNRRITWHVPNRMGDGITPDNWYPYVFVKTTNDSEVDGRDRKIKSQRPGTTEPCWLVHAEDLKKEDLKKGDEIYFTTSTFDFEYLDTTARRFEIHYDTEGRRPRQTRPFYLEDLDRLQKLWEILKNLQTSQRHQVIHTIEATREMWHGQDLQTSWIDVVFKQFVTDTLANAAWPKDKKWQTFSDEERQQLIDAGVRGELADIADLYMEILKER